MTFADFSHWLPVWAVFQIRINLFRIQGIHDNKFKKKFTAEKRIKHFFDQKLLFTYP
jgi:hypothetical protein